MTHRFRSDWLALRESVDHRSRAGELTRRLADWCRARSPLHIVDLGAGTGSNLRYLATRLAGPQHWTLVDHDPALLSLACRHDPPSVEIRTLRADLRHWSLTTVVPAPELVTASALLDLVSTHWLASLVLECRHLGAAVLIALSYDGEANWSHPDPDDSLVRQAVNAHQERDKGLGAALGPRAGAAAAALFRDAGYAVWLKPSAWELGATDAALAASLIAGWVDAAAEQMPEAEARFRTWGTRRTADLITGRTRLRVGHQDLLALPDVGR